MGKIQTITTKVCPTSLMHVTMLIYCYHHLLLLESMFQCMLPCYVNFVYCFSFVFLKEICCYYCTLGLENVPVVTMLLGQCNTVCTTSALYMHGCCFWSHVNNLNFLSYGKISCCSGTALSYSIPITMVTVTAM